MNAMSQLQQSVISRLTATDTVVPSLVPANAVVKWITEDIGDLANAIAKTTGSVGIIGIVLTPGGGKLFEASPTSPISFECPVEIQIQENVTVNRGNAGTKIPVLDLVQFCMRRLHLWSPSNQRANRIALDETPYLLVSEYPVLTYNVRFNFPITIQ
jgi:hypothetical protein